MRIGWSGWRRWPPWLIGYVGIVFIAGSVMLFFLAISSCAGAAGPDVRDRTAELFWAAVTLAAGVLLMAAGVRMITSQLSDDAD